MIMVMLRRFVCLVLVMFTLTACHDDDVFHWVTPVLPTVTPTPSLPTATPLPEDEPIPPTIQPDIAPEEGELIPDPTPEPPCTIIKGNISANGRKLYHTPESPNYNQVKIDEGAGERFFCSEQEAIDAGWTKAGG